MNSPWARGPRAMFFSILVLLFGFAIIPSSQYYNIDTHCNFYQHSCSWGPLGTTWKWVKPAIDSLAYDGPPPGADIEFALLANFSSANHKSTFTLQSPVFEKTGNVSCFSFEYYFMDYSVESTVALNLLWKRFGLDSMAEIWSTGGQMVADRWFAAQVQIERSGPLSLQFSVSGSQGFVAFQEFKYLSVPCNTEDDDVQTCTFESGSCGWKADSETPTFQITKSKDTKLTVGDHTSHSPSGHVMFINSATSFTSRSLTSPKMADLDEQCVSLWYLRTGLPSSMELKLLAKYTKKDKTDILWHSNTTDPIGEWIRVMVDVDIEDPVQLQLVASKSDSSKGALSIDDIRIEDDDCDEPITCGFTFGGFCGWSDHISSSQQNTLSWSLGPGRVVNPSALNLRFVDLYPTHSYLYTDFTGIKAGTLTTMQLNSEIVEAPKTEGACLGLGYTVQSINLKTDSFQLAQIDVKGNQKILWTFNDTKLHVANRVTVLVPTPPGRIPYRLALIAKSINPGTYITISSVTYYSDRAYICNGAVTPPPPIPVPTTVSPKLDPSCDFESGSMCNWKQSGSTYFTVGTTATNGTADPMHFPLSDHTKQSRDGHYLYQYSSGTQYPQSGFLQADNPWPSVDICISFWYYLYTDRVSSFTFKLYDDTRDSVTVYKGFGGYELKWKGVAFTVKQNATAYKRFVIQTKVLKGVLAFDDIKVTPSACPTSTANIQYCDFESDRPCLLEPVYNSVGYKWRIFQASSSTIPDHTTRTTDGHYYGMDLGHVPASVFFHTFAVESPKLTNSQAHCFGFSYLMDSVNPTTTLSYSISYRTDDVPTNTVVWKIAGSTRNMWFNHRAKLPLSAEGRDVRLRMEIEIGRLKKGFGRVFIDDVILYGGNCIGVGECDFEDGNTCTLEPILVKDASLNPYMKHYLTTIAIRGEMATIYLTDYVDQLWHVVSPKQSSKYMSYDHSDYNVFGKYLLLRADDSNDRGIMVTERYSLAHTKGYICLSFAAAIPGDADNVTILEVYQGESLLENVGIKLWDLRKATHGRWRMYHIKATPIHPNSTDIFFYIVGTVGDVKSFIALDDVSSLGEACSNPDNVIPTTTVSPGISTPTSTANPNEFICPKSGKRIAAVKLCDYVKDCDHGEDEDSMICGSCDFVGHKLCRYEVKSDYPSYKWTFSDQTLVGPVTGSNENYLYMIASGTGYGTAYLTSPVIQQAYLFCTFSFSYLYNATTRDASDMEHMTMEVYIQLQNTHKSVRIWQSTYEPLEPKEWTSVELALQRIREPFRISFKTTHYSAVAMKYQAVDDFRLTECEPETPRSDGCLGIMFQCRNKVCISRSALCDFEDDCGDNSDELPETAGCDPKRMTSFESDLNNWDISRTVNGWSRQLASSVSSLRDGPTYDHTSNNGDGHYLIAKKPAELISPALIAADGCRLNFYLFKNSKYSSLVVTVRSLKTGLKKLIRDIRSQDINWIRYTMSLEYWNASEPFQVTLSAPFQGGRDTFVNPYVAIDDVLFTKECKVLDVVPTGIVPTLPNHSTMTTPAPDGCPTVTCRGANQTILCLRSDQLCDFVVDCINRVDENNCGNCTFNDGHTCQWASMRAGDDGDWKVVKAIQSAGRLPKRDADLQTTFGRYAVIAMGYSPSALAYVILRSPRINGRTSSFCTLRFSFFSENGANLYVKVARNSFSSSLFGEHRIATSWTSIEVDVGQQEPGFNIDIAAASSNVFGGFEDVAVDNLQLINCDPKKVVVLKNRTIDCTFEEDLCAWDITGPSGRRSKWERTNDVHREPGGDHTSMISPKPAASGTWLTSQATMDGRYETDYLITTIPLKKGMVYCFSFWYFFFGIELQSSLGLYASKTAQPMNDSDYSALWFTDVPLMRNWAQHYVEIPMQPTDFYLLFIGHVATTTIMGLDDFTLRNGPCSTTSPRFCDFEVNLCDWTRKDSGWQRNQQPTRYKDHSTGTVNGHFLEASNTLQLAVLTKKLPYIFPHFPHRPFILRRPYCLRLYYFWDTDPRDDDTDSRLTLTVSERYRTVTSKNVTLGDNINAGYLGQWDVAMVNFRAGSGTTVQIESFLERASTKLLVDDVSVAPNYCEEGGSCDFENDMCGWTNSIFTWGSKRVYWLRIQPNSLFLRGTFLKYDHTTQTKSGNYLVWPNQMQDHASSVLKSPLLHRGPNSHKICFSLYYFARAANSSVTAFRVRFVDLSRKTNSVEVVHATAQLDDWIHWKKEYTNLPAIYQFFIETVYNGAILSDIGLDDISVSSSGCGGSVQPSSTTPLPPAEKALDCNFDQSPCNWKWDKAVWNLTDFKDQPEYYAPQLDHTYQFSQGKYLLFTKSGSTANQTTFSITSTASLNYDHDHCFTFWYYEDGEDEFSLLVFNQLPQYPLVVKMYNSAIENRRKWSLVKADIHYSSVYNVTKTNLVIRYQPSPARLRQFSVFALDDFKLRPGRCGHEANYVYTFDLGYEDLVLEALQPLLGALGELTTPGVDHIPGAPPIDHTTNSPKGTYYLFMNAPRVKMLKTTYIDTISMVNLPADREMENHCVRFAYQIVGDVSFKVFRLDVDSYDYRMFTPVWVAKFSKDSWTIAEFNVRASYPHKVVLYMEKQPDNSSYLALDDLTILDHTCLPPIDADFEHGHIGSYTPYQSIFRFGLFTVPPADPEWPGPRVDHTTRNAGSGYLYLTAYRSVGTFTQIVSKVISGGRTVNGNDTYCLSLWTMLTTTDLELRLHLVRFGDVWTDANRTKSNIAVLGGVNQTDWTQLQVNIDQTILNSAGEIQLIIEGRIGTNSKGVIAIDDIALKRGQCATSDGKMTCEDGTVVLESQVCDFVKNCPSGMDELDCGGTVDGCDFESGHCGWINMNGAPQLWTQTLAKSSGNSFAPTFDASGHATGHYLLLDKPKIGATAQAEIATNFPTPYFYLKSAYHACVMTFDYYVKTGSTYWIDVRIGADIASWNTIYRISHMATGAWRKAYAHVGERFSPFMMDIAGYLADSSQGAVALDNVKFQNCSMPPGLGPKGRCGSGQFLCTKRRFCIDQSSVCDFVNDCGDDFDESACTTYPARCNFEHSLYTCGITTDNTINSASPSNVEWFIMTGLYYPESYFPKIDNTQRSRLGHFIGLSPKHSGKYKMTNVASFYTPMMSTASSAVTCRLRFFYFINDDPVKVAYSDLQVYIWYAKKLAPEKMALEKFSIGMKEDLQQRWNKGTVAFSSTEPFRFVFKGFLGSIQARIAIDDLSFEPDCIPSSAKPMQPTTVRPPTDGPGSSTQQGSTTPGPIEHHKPASSGKGALVAAILTPLFLVVGIALGYFGFRRYQARQQTEEHFALSMRGIMDKGYN